MLKLDRSSGTAELYLYGLVAKPSWWAGDDVLSALDIDTPQVIQCIAPRSIHSALPAVALPAARRADVAPYGFAVMPNGLMRRTGGTLAGGTLTLDVVPGAVSYVARYWPELTVLVMSLTEHQDVRGAVAGWDLTAEEI